MIWRQVVELGLASVLMAAAVEPAHAQTATDSMATFRLRDLLTNKTDLLDPFSAELRSLVYRRTGARRERWCGEINAKNRYGAFTGWRAFTLSHVDTVTTFHLEDTEAGAGADDLNSRIVSLCGPLGAGSARFRVLARRDSLVTLMAGVGALAPAADSTAEGQLAEHAPTVDSSDVSVTVRAEGVAFEFPEYLRKVVVEVYRRWHRPVGEGPLEAQVTFFIHRDGSVSRLQFTRRSGSFAFDLEVEGAIEAAGNARAFGSLPSRYAADVLPVKFTFRPATVR